MVIHGPLTMAATYVSEVSLTFTVAFTCFSMFQREGQREGDTRMGTGDGLAFG